MKLFLPDWDDRVDPGYDFLTERPTLDRDPWRDDRYAHELLAERCYDGMLVSRSALPRDGKKVDRITADGLRGLLRLPRQMELMGDCGAFGYVQEPVPTYTTEEILAFYQETGVDYGVSVDHIILPMHAEDVRKERYELTLANACDFLRQHRMAGHTFTPVGAVQGWDASSYAIAAKALADAGYMMLAIGGLVRRRTEEILAIVHAVRDAVGSNAQLHLLGVARWTVLPTLVQLGIYSADTASPVRTAWTSASDNYFLGSQPYTALRVPLASPVRGTRATSSIARPVWPSGPTFRRFRQLEQEALTAIRAYADRKANLDETVAAVLEYDEHFVRRTGTSGRDLREPRYRRTLRDRPWEKCGCSICSEIGVEVVIFRGANRNRRRGFHNLRQLYKRLDGALQRADEATSLRG